MSAGGLLVLAVIVMAIASMYNWLVLRYVVPVLIVASCVAVGAVGGARYRSRWREVLLSEHGRCLQCDYSILGIPPDADGCTVCPECGAAWKLPETAEDAGARET